MANPDRKSRPKSVAEVLSDSIMSNRPLVLIPSPEQHVLGSPTSFRCAFDGSQRRSTWRLRAQPPRRSASAGPRGRAPARSRPPTACGPEIGPLVHHPGAVATPALISFVPPAIARRRHGNRRLLQADRGIDAYPRAACALSAVPFSGSCKRVYGSAACDAQRVVFRRRQRTG